MAAESITGLEAEVWIKVEGGSKKLAHGPQHGVADALRQRGDAQHFELAVHVALPYHTRTKYHAHTIHQHVSNAYTLATYQQNISDTLATPQQNISNTLA